MHVLKGSQCGYATRTSTSRSRFFSACILTAIVANVYADEFQDEMLACSRLDVSFFKALSCADGAIGETQYCNCTNTQGTCELQLTRSYLPAPSMLENINHMCDRLFTHGFSRHLLQSKVIKPHSGYPQDCKDVHGNGCHQPSLGKYVRYNSIMLFHAYQGNPNETLMDISYTYPFRWATAVDECAINNPENANGWGCAFQPLSLTVQDDEHDLLQHAWSKNKDTLEALMPLVDASRRGNKNHVAQILLYSRLLSLLATPSELIRNYMKQHTMTLHRSSSILRNSGAESKPPPAISMHVRQGDSCDKILNYTVPEMTHYLQGDVRPCFSVDVYMSMLRELQEMYGSYKVYLSTDSAEMLKRIQTEDSFTWIRVESDVTAYQGRSGPQRFIDFLPQSADKDVLFGGVSDLVLLSQGDIFLGCFSSHFSKLIYYRMVGHHMRILPFKSLDYPLSCDTVDACDAQDILNRGMTMERIAMWAVECIRNASPWSPGGDRDPCGIYL